MLLNDITGKPAISVAGHITIHSQDCQLSERHEKISRQSAMNSTTGNTGRNRVAKMKFSEDRGHSELPLLGYGAGWVNVNGNRLTHGFALGPDQFFENLALTEVQALNAEHIQHILRDREADLILIGTGATQRLPDSTVIKALAEHGKGFEIMNTGAACRTYNVLLSEGRKVIAILFPA